MKKLIVILSIMLFYISVNAQTFEASLSAALSQFERNDTLQNKLNAANRIDLITNQWSDKWPAHYYSAYSKIVLSYLLQDEKQRDAFIDKAQIEIAEVKKLKGVAEDEILVMEAYAANARLSVNSRNRWKKQGAIFDAKLEEAKKLNAANPRIYFLKGQSIFHTPKAFGGGARKALPFFEKAESYFQNEAKDKLEMPHWGSYRNAFYINECKKG
jgi:hypothetical protein